MKKVMDLCLNKGRRIARIDYDMMNNPVRIQFTNGNVTKYVYSATGEKLRVIYQTAVPNISVAIGSTRELMQSEILFTDSTDYLLGGALTMRNGRIDKYQFEEGYCQATQYNATQDNFTFLYYDKDHLGNVRQVTKASNSTGTVVQTMNYYPFGAQFCDGSAATSDFQQYKYNGKELDKMHGLNTYDYGARQYNPITARWDRMDPLAEKYYSISPYAYCAGNPVKYVDPDGRKIDTSNMNEEEQKAYNDILVSLFESEMFKTLYDELQKSIAIFYISLDKIKDTEGNLIDGQFVTGDNEGGYIYLDRDKTITNNLSAPAIFEEFFHAYQNDNRSKYTGEFNREFEAKTFCIAATGQSSSLYRGMESWSDELVCGKYSGLFETISVTAVSSTQFLEEYVMFANKYASFNKENKIGNIEYKRATTCKPQNLINIINLTYKK